MKKTIIIFSLCFLAFSCNKDVEKDSRYDSSLVHQNACTSDCPGFTGCNGNTYCNECKAARVGIGPQ